MRLIIITEQDRAEFIRRIQAIELGKRRFVGELKVHRKVRSLASNNLYWMWISCISRETGNDTETLHNYFKQKFLAWDSVQVFGEEQQRYVTTTQLDSKQFSEYMEKIKLFAAENAIFLPEPGEQAFDSFYQEYKK
jgi:hypothetical protein